MPRCLRPLLSALLLLPLATASSALTVTIGASDSGSHSSSGNHNAAIQAYTVGWASNTLLRDFYVFDLSSLPAGETVLSATLRVFNPAAGGSFGNGYDSPNPNESYNLREVTLSSVVVTAPSTLNPAVYNDLGDGTIFGTHLASSADNGNFVEIALNGFGIAAVQNFMGVGQFVLGGEISTLSAAFGTDEFLFGFTAPGGVPYTRELEIEVTPEPGTGALLGLGLAGLTAARRARARRIG